MFKTKWHTELVEHILDWNGKWQTKQNINTKKIYLSHTF
jgi:hypothetical protein